MSYTLLCLRRRRWKHIHSAQKVRLWKIPMELPWLEVPSAPSSISLPSSLPSPSPLLPLLPRFTSSVTRLNTSPAQSLSANIDTNETFQRLLSLKHEVGEWETVGGLGEAYGRFIQGKEALTTDDKILKNFEGVERIQGLFVYILWQRISKWQTFCWSMPQFMYWQLADKSFNFILGTGIYM